MDFNILIVEDHIPLSLLIKGMVEQLGFPNCSVANSIPEARERLATASIDLILLDITFEEEMSGIEFGKEINQNYAIPFIFITSHSDSETITRAAAVHPWGYLIKPIAKESLFAGIQIAIAGMGNSPVKEEKTDDQESDIVIGDAIFIRFNGFFHKIQFDDILWILSNKNYIELKTEEKKFVLRISMAKFSSRLPKGQFIRVHRSYMINIQRIKKIGPTFLFLDEHEIPVGPGYRDNLKEALNFL